MNGTRVPGQTVFTALTRPRLATLDQVVQGFGLAAVPDRHALGEGQVTVDQFLRCAGSLSRRAQSSASSVNPMMLLVVSACFEPCCPSLSSLSGGGPPSCCPGTLFGAVQVVP